ncbi:agglutination protein [Vibrio sp. qd031]|nr:agglutination protein [Vibrio sp. qd031]
MKRISICTIALSVLVSQPVMAESLEQAISATLATNPLVRSSYNEYMSFVKSYDSSRGAYLPSVDLEAGIGYERIRADQSGDSDLTRKDAAIRLTQLLWDGSATINDIDRTAAEANSMRYQLFADAENIALEVSKLYLDALSAEEVLLLSESNLKVHRKIYSDILKRTQSGIGSTADLSQVEARLAKAHSNLLAAQNNLYDSHVSYRRIVGSMPIGLVKPHVDENKIPLSVELAFEDAKKNHPVLKIAQADVDAAQYQYKQSQSVNLPTFTIEAAHSWEQDAGGVEGDVNETSAMLRMRYNLYNGGKDSDNIERTAYQLSKSKDFRDRAFRQVEEGLRLSWNALDLTLQQREFLIDHVDAASNTVIAYEKQYKIGKRTLLDLLNTENELFEARKEYVTAQYAELYAKFRVLNASGVLLPSLLVDTPEAWNNEVN